MKHTPQRTCIACRHVRPKRDLVRVVCAPEGGVKVDETSKANGRGAYLCRNRLCWQAALGDRRRSPRSRLGAALHTVVTEQEWIALWEYGQQLPVTIDSVGNARRGEIEGDSLDAR